MYKIKRFSSLTNREDPYSKKPSKAAYTAGAAIQGGLLANAGYEVGKIVGASHGASKYNKWAKDIAERQIPDLARRARQGSEHAADVLNRLNHPKTRVAFQDISRKSIEKGSKIGGKIGAGVGATLGVGSAVIGYKIHKNKYNKINKNK